MLKKNGQHFTDDIFKCIFFNDRFDARRGMLSHAVHVHTISAARAKGSRNILNAKFLE